MQIKRKSRENQKQIKSKSKANQKKIKRKPTDIKMNKNKSS
jgi:hypothetical protein